MIDTTKPYYYITNRLLDALKDDGHLHSKGVKLYGNKFFLPHPFGLQNPMVRISWKDRTLCLETSLPKLLQGHNVFGSNRVENLCLAVVELIYKHLGVPFDRKERRIIKRRRIRLGRLDLTSSFLMESQREVAEAIQIIQEQLWAEGRSWSAYGQGDVESVYHQPRSTRVSDKFYNKYLELQVNCIPGSVEHKQLILVYALILLRFEVTYLSSPACL